MLCHSAILKVLETELKLLIVQRERRWTPYRAFKRGDVDFILGKCSLLRGSNCTSHSFLSGGGRYPAATLWENVKTNITLRSFLHRGFLSHCQKTWQFPVEWIHVEQHFLCTLHDWTARCFISLKATIKFTAVQTGTDQAFLWVIVLHLLQPTILKPTSAQCRTVVVSRWRNSDGGHELEAHSVLVSTILLEKILELFFKTWRHRGTDSTCSTFKSPSPPPYLSPAGIRSPGCGKQNGAGSDSVRVSD